MADILVIDDEEGLRFTFQAFLKADGHLARGAESYAEALAELDLRTPDLIFADVVLREYSGIDILREVRKRKLTCPVVMITGSPKLSSASEAVRLGAFDYLTKPVRKDELLRITRLALERKFLSDERERLHLERETYRLKLEAIVRSVPEAIVTVDPDMRVLHVNPQLGEMCGLDVGNVVGREFEENVRHCPCREVLHQILRTGDTIKEYRVECENHADINRTLILNGSPLLGQQGESIGAVLVIRDITAMTDLERELRERRRYRNIIGNCRAMRKVFELIASLSDTDTTALITGESGTGKELAAEALHYGGSRSQGPLVKVNCSALSENLLESELFGHVRGAFTGAVKDKVGRIQKATGGTIFLDEIGDISPTVQLKLLRFLEEREFERVGDSTTVKADVRVIAATNRSLRERVTSGAFREDLFYRLKVVEIHIPPLRERGEDILLLARHFMTHFCGVFRKNITGMTPTLVEALLSYNWPGNVRELRHAIEHAFVLCRGGTLDLAHLPEDVRLCPRTGGGSVGMEDDEKARLLEALGRTGWNMSKAARVLGISRQTMYRKITQYGLVRPSS